MVRASCAQPRQWLMTLHEYIPVCFSPNGASGRRRIRKNFVRVRRESNVPSRVVHVGRDATLPSMAIQYAEFFSRCLEVYTDGKVSASSNGLLQLMHSAMRLLDRDVRVRAHAGVGIRDRDSTEALSADHVRHLVRRRVAVDEEVIFRCVTVRPAIDGDAFDVGGRVEAAAAQCAAQLVADLTLEGFERGGRGVETRASSSAPR